MTDVAENLARLLERVRAAEAASARPEGSVRVLAVTKGLPAERVEEGIAAGLDRIGENRVQEAAEKKPRVKARASWHLIGHLQTNKVARALEVFDVIQTLDSERLAGEIEKRAAGSEGSAGRRPDASGAGPSRGRIVRALVEVNVSGESTKTGTTPEGLFTVLEAAARMPHLRVLGLMALGPLTEDEARVRSAFARVRDLARGAVERGLLRPEGEGPELSMGMSDDFEAAIREGSTMIRIGQALFGSRPGHPHPAVGG